MNQVATTIAGGVVAVVALIALSMLALHDKVSGDALVALFSAIVGGTLGAHVSERGTRNGERAALNGRHSANRER